MTSQEKIQQLKGCIYNSLTHLIDGDYVLFDVPYYTNIGDTLIWEGTKHFLKNIPHKCLYTASVETYKYRPLQAGTVILMQGGGNFGDLWRRHQDLRLEVIKAYPNNKIIVLPQTVFYKDDAVLQEDAKIFNSHKNLHICARDTISFEYLQQTLTCSLLLVPDMAFYITDKLLKRYSKKVGDRALLLKRNDTEFNEYDFGSYITEESTMLDTCDWPTMEQQFKAKMYLDKLIWHKETLGILPDIYADWIFRPFQVKKGVEFVSQYKKVYTTRLHVAILSLLLDKEIVFFDNSYGKNSSFYDTWLKGVENITFIR